MNIEHEDAGPQAGAFGWPMMPALWPAWTGWMAWVYQWQQAWTGALTAWPGLSGVRPTLPLLWDPGFLMPRVDARITPVVSEEGSEAARVSMMMRMPRYGCVGPADLVAVEAFIARRPDPAALVEAAHPAQTVAPLPPASVVPAKVARTATGKPAGKTAAKVSRPAKA